LDADGKRPRAKVARHPWTPASQRGAALPGPRSEKRGTSAERRGKAGPEKRHGDERKIEEESKRVAESMDGAEPGRPDGGGRECPA
jgi:hypothetical protein